MLTLSDSLSLLGTLAVYVAFGLVSGLLAYAATELLRKLPGLEMWALTGRRPLSCDFCMSFWTAAIWALVFRLAAPWLAGAVGIFGQVVAFGLSIAVCLLALGWASALPAPDPPR